MRRPGDQAAQATSSSLRSPLLRGSFSSSSSSHSAADSTNCSRAALAVVGRRSFGNLGLLAVDDRPSSSRRSTTPFRRNRRRRRPAGQMGHRVRSRAWRGIRWPSSKSARSRSMPLMKATVRIAIGLRLKLRGPSGLSRPSRRRRAETTTTAPSRPRRAIWPSAWKFGSPGVSTRVKRLAVEARRRRSNSRP